MPKLIWVFARRTDHFVGFAMLRLKLAMKKEQRPWFKRNKISVSLLVGQLVELGWNRFVDHVWCSWWSMISMPLSIANLSIMYLLWFSGVQCYGNKLISLTSNRKGKKQTIFQKSWNFAEQCRLILWHIIKGLISANCQGTPVRLFAYLKFSKCSNTMSLYFQGHFCDVDSLWQPQNLSRRITDIIRVLIK